LSCHRDPGAARDFMLDLAGRLAGRVQLTSDGLKFYRQAVKAGIADHIWSIEEIIGLLEKREMAVAA
jgi:hypothetical protein